MSEKETAPKWLEAVCKPEIDIDLYIELHFLFISLKGSGPMLLNVLERYYSFPVDIDFKMNSFDTILRTIKDLQ